MSGLAADQEGQFIESILRETALCKDDDFVVVKDANPVTKDHYLLVTRRVFRSLADTDCHRVERFLMNEFAQACLLEYSIFEHGHGRFCSALGNFVHAHAHLVPTNTLSTIDFQYGEPTSHDSLAAALKSIPSSYEYLLWGQLGKAINVIVQPDMPKQAIRLELQKAKVG